MVDRTRETILLGLEGARNTLHREYRSEWARKGGAHGSRAEAETTIRYNEPIQLCLYEGSPVESETALATSHAID